MAHPHRSDKKTSIADTATTVFPATAMGVEKDEEDYETWVRSTLLIGISDANSIKSNRGIAEARSTSAKRNIHQVIDTTNVGSDEFRGRYFCKGILQPRRDVYHVHLKKLKPLLQHTSMQPGNLGSFCLAPWTKETNDQKEVDEGDGSTNNLFWNGSAVSSCNEDEEKSSLSLTNISKAEENDDDVAYTPRLFCMGVWRNMDAFDRFMNNFNSMDYIDYGNLECFPKMTFWESFHDVKPPHEMYHWTRAKKLPSLDDKSHLASEGQDVNRAQDMSSKRQKWDKGKDVTCFGRSCSVPADASQREANLHDPVQILVAMTSFNVRKCKTIKETDLLFETAKALLCKEADFCRRSQFCNKAFGNVTYDLFTASEDTKLEEASQNFLIYEEWSSQDAFNLYRSTSHYQKFASIVSKYFLPRQFSPQTNKEEATHLETQVTRYLVLP